MQRQREREREKSNKINRNEDIFQLCTMHRHTPWFRASHALVQHTAHTDRNEIHRAVKPNCKRLSFSRFVRRIKFFFVDFFWHFEYVIVVIQSSRINSISPPMVPHSLFNFSFFIVVHRSTVGVKNRVILSSLFLSAVVVVGVVCALAHTHES